MDWPLGFFLCLWFIASTCCRDERTQITAFLSYCVVIILSLRFVWIYLRSDQNLRHVISNDAWLIVTFLLIFEYRLDRSELGWRPKTTKSTRKGENQPELTIIFCLGSTAFRHFKTATPQPSLHPIWKNSVYLFRYRYLGNVPFKLWSMSPEVAALGICIVAQAWRIPPRSRLLIKTWIRRLNRWDLWREMVTF
jgi:hypothetical protein